jgi:hypothetical protein
MQSGMRANPVGENFSTSRGELSLWEPTQGLLICRFRDHGEKQFAAHVIRAFDAQRAERVHLFFDLAQMPTYDSDLRVLLTKHFSEHRARFEQFDVLVGSKLVAMGVEVARLALGSFLRPHTKRPAFTASLDAAVASRHLIGFTSGVLQNAQRPSARP